jgi:hypothetical protein
MGNTNQKSNTTAKGAKNGTAVRSVRRAAGILSCISNGISSVTEIAEKSGYAAEGKPE